MKRLLPLLIILALLLPLTSAYAGTTNTSVYPTMWAYTPLEDEQLKKILADPNTDKTQGLPNQLVKAIGKRAAQKKIDALTPKSAKSYIIDPSLYPVGWDVSQSTFNSLDAALAYARQQKASSNHWPSSFYFYSAGLLYHGILNDAQTQYNIYYFNSSTWVHMLTVTP